MSLSYEEELPNTFLYSLICKKYKKMLTKIRLGSILILTNIFYNIKL